MYLTIELPDAKDVKLNLKPDGHFNFSAKGPDDMQYELDLELFDAVNVEVRVIADKCQPLGELSYVLILFIFAGKQGRCRPEDYMLPCQES